ncbi:hypothetical protein EH223_08040 [candidate division KSB1 bacterium]|nr:hypothetical protein [candidate division KSB1 bacterium]RQW04143.1 MAG: hypothetical protein EH223_08040 [candidate division KSB1 bacterium]
MKSFHLRFCKRQHSGFIADISSDPILSIPDTGGAFVLGTADGTSLIYPWGTSPVFYIGETANLYKRFEQYRESLRAAQKDHEKFWGYPRYQYGAAFGASLAWFLLNNHSDLKSLESDLIYCFYEMYGAIPVANGVWPSGIKKSSNC